jgi:hypothetical protein
MVDFTFRGEATGWRSLAASLSVCAEISLGAILGRFQDRASASGEQLYAGSMRPMMPQRFQSGWRSTLPGRRRRMKRFFDHCGLARDAAGGWPVLTGLFF